MKRVLFLVFLSVAISSCSEEDTIIEDGTYNRVIINAESFENAPSDPLTINDLKIEGDSLKINFSASGCDGNSWEVKLIDSEDILESLPPSRNLRLSLSNQEVCSALITKDISFGISDLQVEGNSVQLNVINSSQVLVYSY